MIRCLRQSGYILLPVIMVITLLAALALLMTTESGIESNITGSELDTQRARYVAEAGMNHALWQTRQQGCGPYGDLVDVPIGNDKYNSTLTTDLGGTTAFTVAVVQDTWIHNALPDNNHALDPKLHIRSEAGVIERPMLRYDLSAITANSVILSATAWFYVNKDHLTPIDIHRISTGWTEASATWTNMGDYHHSDSLATIPAQPVLGVWVSVNLTTQVQAWVNGQPNFGITLNSTSDGSHGEYSSRESANVPYLDVVVGTPPTSPAALTAVATLANGMTRDLTRTDVILTQYPTSFVQWQHDAGAGVDTYIWEFMPTTKYGIDDESWIARSSNNDALSLFKFDVDSLLPGTRIYNATLSLLHESGNNTDVPISAHRIVNSWDEDNATWQKRDSGINWDTNGGDLDQRVVSTTLVGPTSNIRYQWDLTSLVQGWADNAYPNYGVALRTLQNGSIGERFYSSDEIDATRRPRLTITYGCTCGDICVTPQGVGNLLMVVDDSFTLLAADAAKIALFESWGYTVLAIDGTNTQAVYDAAFAVSDVAFLSATVMTGQAGSRLMNAPIGVVSQDGDYNADLGFSSGSAWTVGSAINVAATDHYITAPFATGTLEIYANAMEQLTVNGSESIELTTLADSAGNGSLVLLDTGDALEGGGTAVGRRVMLPLGRESNFNWAQLNNNGRLLVQRSLAWGAGADQFTVPPIKVLLMVGNATSLASKDSGIKLLMEAWGYDVILVDDGDSQTNIDFAAAAVDVVYVSGTTSAAALAGKLDGSLTPIVNEVGAQLDNFGFSSTAGTGLNESVFVDTNPAHYISEPFLGSALLVLTTNLAMPIPNGTLAPGLQTVGQIDGPIPALVTLDIGAERWDSTPAAARRAQLPFANAESSELSPDGEMLMQRAIEWAAGANNTSGLVAPIAHWKLDEISGTNALDSEGVNDGTLTNGPIWIAGLVDGGLDFDGTNDYVEAGVFDVTGTGITMTGWFNAEVIATDDGRIVSKANGTTESDAWWQLSTNDSGPDRFLRMRIKAGGTTTTLADSSENLSTAQWYFAVGTYDSATGEMKLYLDGVEIASGAHAIGGAVDTDAAVPVAIGANGTAERFFNGILDDVRVYDRALEASEISALYDANAPLGPVSYTELYQTWSSDQDNTWKTVDLGVYGVPADAVVEIALVNSKIDRKRYGGVRATGSSLDRRFRLHEAESDGVEVMTMHVQADSASQIEHYSERKSEVTFVLLGYWVGASYGELHDSFNALISNTWQVESLGDEGVMANQVAEIAIINNHDSAERLAGIRAAGSSLVRSFDLHESEAGGIDTVTMMVETDSYSRVQVYAEADIDIDFHVLGYWRTPPGVYTEFGGGSGSPTVSANWQVGDLSGFGVPADSIAQFVLGNENDSTEINMGVRATGSVQDRFINLHEAEAGGADLITMHANVDAGSQVEWYSSSGASNASFYPVGWWTVSP